MWSRSATFARPVRTPASSLRKSSTAFSIRVRACTIASLLLAITLIALSPRSLRRHRRTHLFAHHHAADISRPIHIENNDRHAVVHAQRNGGRIHHGKAFLDDVQVSNAFKHCRAGHFFRIGVIDAVHAGRLQDDVSFNLHGAQRGGRVRREIRIAGARGENHNASFFEVPHRPAADKWLGNLGHVNRAQESRDHALFLERILQREAVDDRRQHAHVVAGGAIDRQGFLACAAEDFSSAHNNCHFNAQIIYFFHFAGDAVNGFGVNAKTLCTLKRFSGKLQNDASGNRRRRGVVWVGRTVVVAHALGGYSNKNSSPHSHEFRGVFYYVRP